MMAGEKRPRRSNTPAVQDAMDRLVTVSGRPLLGVATCKESETTSQCIPRALGACFGVVSVRGDVSDSSLGIFRRSSLELVRHLRNVMPAFDRKR